MASAETGLLLAPQLKAMLDSEAYHYCADCHNHCRQTILAVEAAKEATKAHASDAEQLMELRKAGTATLTLIQKLYDQDLIPPLLQYEADRIKQSLKGVLGTDK